MTNNDICLTWAYDSGTDWFGVRGANIEDVSDETLNDALKEVTQELKRRESLKVKQ
jgi:hypothetical protein